MSREAFGDPPESQEAPELCPVCGGTEHSEDCEFGKECARRRKAERDAHKLAHENEWLRRLSSLDAMRAGKLAEDVERHSALHARLFVEKTAAQIDAENLREVLHRMLEAPTTQISAGWKDAIRRAMWSAVPDNRRARAASTRSPSRPSGTGSIRESLTAGPGPVEGDAAHTEQRHQARCGDDGDIGDIADEDAVVDEVDDMPPAETGLSEQPVGEIAQRPAEEQPERDGPAPAADPPTGPDDDDEDDDGQDRQEPGAARSDREGRTGVADEPQREQVTEHGDPVSVGERRRRPQLAPEIGEI